MQVLIRKRVTAGVSFLLKCRAVDLAESTEEPQAINSTSPVASERRVLTVTEKTN